MSNTDPTPPAPIGLPSEKTFLSPREVGRWEQFFHSRLGRHVVNWGVILIFTIACSETLSKFSATTLVFPESWHKIVITSGSLLGIVAFEAGQNYRKKWDPSDSTVLAVQNPKAPPFEAGFPLQSPFRFDPLRVRIWASLAALIIFICCFVILRGICVRYFDPTLWITQQAKVDAFIPAYHGKSAAEIDKTAADGPTTKDTALHNEMSEAAKLAVESSTSADSEKRFPVPDFINLRSRLICIPLWFPREHQDYLNAIATPDNDGVAVVLDQQPVLMVNWLTGDTRMYLVCTTIVFLVAYLLITFSVTYLLGLRFEPASGIIELLFGVG